MSASAPGPREGRRRSRGAAGDCAAWLGPHDLAAMVGLAAAASGGQAGAAPVGSPAGSAAGPSPTVLAARLSTLLR
ncbi:hypothetical protein ACFFOM_03925 [Microlunatus capsulatus]|uniref:Uncharacterized protein n=1 Tax=Microlunatus capsulatus TaxID=99117 RepID=A0ABS4Z241_9ACTN|nr:hypothetical protein [Microlunatus capsulatus]MBP2415119.1 hypothetical protein [Microlunatus capsulatus]